MVPGFLLRDEDVLDCGFGIVRSRHLLRHLRVDCEDRDYDKDYRQASESMLTHDFLRILGTAAPIKAAAFAFTTACAGETPPRQPAGRRRYFQCDSSVAGAVSGVSTF